MTTSSDELTVENYTSIQDWVEVCIKAFKDGYGVYLFTEYKKHKIVEKQGMSMFLAAAIGFGTKQDDTLEDNYSKELYNYILRFTHNGKHLLTTIDEKTLTCKGFNELMLCMLFKFKSTL